MIVLGGALANFGLAVLGWAILHFLWQGALLGGLLEGILVGLRRARPAVRERVALVGLVLFLFIFGATVARIGNGAVADLRIGLEAGLGTGSIAQPTVSSFAGWLGAIAPFVGLAWLALVAVRALQLAASVRALRRLREAAMPLHAGELAARLPDLTRRSSVRREVRVGISAAVDVPTLTGWRSPIILLPGDAVRALPAAALAGVVAHELAHVRRHDAVTQAFLVVVRALLGFHPCTHRLVQIAEHERESCCDDAALQAGAAPLPYARALAQLERLRSHPMSFAVAAARGPLIDRVRRIVHPTPALTTGRTWGMALGGVVMAAVLGHVAVRSARARDLDARPVQHAAMRFAAHRAEFVRHHHGNLLPHEKPTADSARQRIVLRDVTHAPEPRAP